MKRSLIAWIEHGANLVWFNRQTGKYEPLGEKQEIYRLMYRLQEEIRGGEVNEGYNFKNEPIHEGSRL